MGARFAGLVMDFAGVLTSNMVEVVGLFEARERLMPGTFLRAWAAPRGQEFYRRLEAGEIDQRAWNAGFAALMGIDGENLMGRLLYELDPAYEVIRVVKEARATGIRTALLSNSLGRDPHDPYALYDLSGTFDVVVLSAEQGIRKPDPAIFHPDARTTRPAAALLRVRRRHRGQPPTRASNGHDRHPRPRRTRNRHTPTETPGVAEAIVSGSLHGSAERGRLT